MDLTQAEANALLAMEKYRTDGKAWNFPAPGGQIVIPLQSQDRHEKFLLDIGQSGRIVLKGKYQNRARQAVILARLDFGGGIHRNPDGEEIECPHLHLYREGCGDKWAIPVPVEHFRDTSDIWKVLPDFMRYCNVVDPPNVARTGGMFS